MLIVVAGCALLLMAATLCHYEALRGLGRLLPRLRMASRARLGVVIVGAFVSHMLQIALFAVGAWALARVGVGTLGDTARPSLDMALYFSAETFTSLGYGDVVPHGPLRLLAGVEALTGLLLIGWSTSFTYVSMARFWTPEDSEATASS
jgi:hypothetical protein